MYAVRQTYEHAQESIPVPKSMRHQRIEVIFMVLDEVEILDENQKVVVKRSPPKHLIGLGETMGDLTQPLVDEQAWTCLK
ncbi:hypothetical protein QLH32_00975 [Acinetobacter corruptisaponis]|uniref:Uncharacterized protein n=1 Tax=Acinetobacter corruptisaponis TaxID=3045147 RepID=A0ABY8S5M9_9GAMM|nr:hypothetical protein [Acinetobacter sp. KCTC 92772]WHP06083.1 hypothetical protein QLH32_00975 [Acinetobacter sp. KCTC 92772]